jgi:hypothetical protein
MDNEIIYQDARALFEQDQKLVVADLVRELEDAYTDAHAKTIPTYKPIEVENRTKSIEGSFTKNTVRREFSRQADEGTFSE